MNCPPATATGIVHDPPNPASHTRAKVVEVVDVLHELVKQHEGGDGRQVLLVVHHRHAQVRVDRLRQAGKSRGSKQNVACAQMWQWVLLCIATGQTVVRRRRAEAHDLRFVFAKFSSLDAARSTRSVSRCWSSWRQGHSLPVSDRLVARDAQGKAGGQHEGRPGKTRKREIHHTPFCRQGFCKHKMP